MANLDWDDILNLLEQGEGQSVEFEKQIPGEDDIARELVAFSNCDGGKLILGIDDKNKHFLGIDIDSSFKDWLEEIGKTRCRPPIKIDVEILEKNDKKIVLITVPEGEEKPYKTDDICYIRDISVSRPATEEEEKSITNPWGGKGLNKRQLRALQLVQEHGSITNRDFREAFGVSHKTAHLELTMLLDKRLLRSEGAGRSTCYILPQKSES